MSAYHFPPAADVLRLQLSQLKSLQSRFRGGTLGVQIILATLDVGSTLIEPRHMNTAGARDFDLPRRQIDLNRNLWDALTATNEKVLVGTEDSPDHHLPIERVGWLGRNRIFTHYMISDSIRALLVVGKDELAVYRIDPDASNPALQDLIDGRWTPIFVDGHTHANVSGY